MFLFHDREPWMLMFDGKSTLMIPLDVVTVVETEGDMFAVR